MNNKTQTEKSETFLLAHALLLLVLSLLVGVQGIFEIIDYMPHISNVASEMECTGLIPVQPETEDERDSYLELSSTSLPPVWDEDDDKA